MGIVAASLPSSMIGQPGDVTLINSHKAEVSVEPAKNLVFDGFITHPALIITKNWAL
jgi:hypothetical protein